MRELSESERLSWRHNEELWFYKLSVTWERFEDTEIQGELETFEIFQNPLREFVFLKTSFTWMTFREAEEELWEYILCEIGDENWKKQEDSWSHPMRDFKLKLTSERLFKEPLARNFQISKKTELWEDLWKGHEITCEELWFYQLYLTWVYYDDIRDRV